MKESYEQAKELLAANRDAMDEIAAYLIQKETITGKEFMEIFHQVIAKRNGNAEEAVENPEVYKESEKARREQRKRSLHAGHFQHYSPKKRRVIWLLISRKN